MKNKREIFSALIVSLVFLTIGGVVLWLNYQSITKPDPVCTWEPTTKREWCAKP